MSEIIRPTPSGSLIPASIITLTPSPTTVFITDRITFTTVLTLSTLIQLLPHSPIPPIPPPPPPESLTASATDRNFIILVSITGATLILFLLLAITSLCFLYRYRQNQKRPPQTSETETHERVTETPALTAFPLPPATPRAPTTDTNNNLPMSTSQFVSTSSGEEGARPTTGPSTRPYRSASTPFLGPEYENKMFSTLPPTRFPPPVPLPQLPKPAKSKTPPSFDRPIAPTVPSFSETFRRLPPGKESTPPRFTEEETQIGEPEVVASWFGIPGEGREFEEHRETFDFFRFPVGSEAVGTRASSGVLPDEREKGREARGHG